MFQDPKLIVEPGINLLFIIVPYTMSFVTSTSSWMIILFIFVIFLGIDTQFAYMHTIIVGFSDLYPNFWRKRKQKLICFICTLFFVLGLPLTCNVSIYFYFNIPANI